MEINVGKKLNLVNGGNSSFVLMFQVELNPQQRPRPISDGSFKSKQCTVIIAFPYRHPFDEGWNIGWLIVNVISLSTISRGPFPLLFTFTCNLSHTVLLKCSSRND